MKSRRRTRWLVIGVIVVVVAVVGGLVAWRFWPAPVASPDRCAAVSAPDPGATMIGSTGVRAVLPPGFTVTADNGRVSTIGDASTPRYYIWVTRDDGSSAIRPRTSAQAVEEFLNRHFDQLGAEFLRSLQRAQWTSNGLDGASIRASRTGVPGYLALVGCRGLRWEVATSFSEVFDTADAIAHSLQEAGPSTRA